MRTSPRRSARLGVHDAAPVTAEPFGQWIIEDRIAAARPRWEDAGAQFVRDVAPFELMKLRLLNGSHSTLAYLGFLMGHEFVWQASRDPLLATLIERQMAEEIVPTLVAAAGHRPCAPTAAQLLERFRNAALPHRTRQIAMDGSQKLPQRLLGTVRDRLAAGAPLDASAARDRGMDPLRERQRRARRPHRRAGPAGGDLPRNRADAGGDPGPVADGFLDLASVFGARSRGALRVSRGGARPRDRAVPTTARR